MNVCNLLCVCLCVASCLYIFHDVPFRFDCCAHGAPKVRITVGQNRDASAATWNRVHDDRTQSRNECPAKLLNVGGFWVFVLFGGYCCWERNMKQRNEQTKKPMISNDHNICGDNCVLCC